MVVDLMSCNKQLLRYFPKSVVCIDLWVISNLLLLCLIFIFAFSDQRVQFVEKCDISLCLILYRFIHKTT